MSLIGASAYMCTSNTFCGFGKKAARMLASNMRDRAMSYNTKLLMWPWGHDFRFTDAMSSFEQMDRIVDEINSNPSTYGVKLQYATPAEYGDVLIDGGGA
jgi:hypothetical protein